MLHTYKYLYLEREDFIVHRALLGVEYVEHFWGFYWSLQLDIILLLYMNEGQGVLWSKSCGSFWIAEWFFAGEELVLVWCHLLWFTNVSNRSDNVLFLIVC